MEKKVANSTDTLLKISRTAVSCCICKIALPVLLKSVQIELSPIPHLYIGLQLLHFDL